MSRNIFSSAVWLNAESNRGYGKDQIPNGRDGEITELLQFWSSLASADREEAAQGIHNDQRYTLLAYSERAASRAVRSMDIGFAYFGLLASGVDGWRSDWRENSALLCLHYDAIIRCGKDPSLAFEQASLLLQNRSSAAMVAFIDRPSEDKTLESMGYEVGSDHDGFRYRRTW